MVGRPWAPRQAWLGTAYVAEKNLHQTLVRKWQGRLHWRLLQWGEIAPSCPRQGDWGFLEGRSRQKPLRGAGLGVRRRKRSWSRHGGDLSWPRVRLCQEEGWEEPDQSYTWRESLSPAWYNTVDIWRMAQL